ncbi:methylmalonyl-CoA carboxyltransferase [Candidatus Woesearchaeota archaeon]|nr:methylmalonyl-CoA carboxyltransferase [Candidatus Woesearchaeota archaeon]|tara:strand:+ start:2017 stop:3513 length:1497 start_codon:yes stop_codon:yes gene_type:complete
MAKEDKELVKKQHDKGKLTARERIDLLLDKDSFTELNELMELKSTNYDLQEKKKAGDGVITGYGKINDRPVCVFAQDFNFMGGSMGEMHNKKIVSIQEHALKIGCPIISLFDSGGARIQEGIHGLDIGGKIFKNNTLASGVIPQISVILGPCAGIAVYSPALTDFTFMTKKISNMFITGPDVIKTVTNEEIDFEGLGGPLVHNEESGVAHFITENEKDCFSMVKLLLSYLPQNNMENPNFISLKDSPNRENKNLKDIVPKDSKKAYDVKQVIEEVVDKNTFLEIQPLYAQNAVIGLARLNSNSIGIVANQPKVLAGCLDINSSDKIARFVRFCDNFNIPIINLVDVTGYLPGVEQEHNGIIRHGAKVLYAYSEATVPKISLVMRKAYGGAYIALVSKDMGYDKVIAWPDSEIAVMGAEQAVNIIHRRELKGKDAEKIKQQRVKEYKEQFLNPYDAAKNGKVDIIAEKKDTRKILINCLDMIMTKREKRPAKKHGNIPL